MKLGRPLLLALLGLVVIALPAHAVPTTVAHWAMDEAAGTVMNDSSGFGNSGMLQNVTLGVPGFTGTGYGFNGTSSLLRRGASSWRRGR